MNAPPTRLLIAALAWVAALAPAARAQDAPRRTRPWAAGRSAARGRADDAGAKPSGSMAADASFDGRVSGLALAVRPAGWPLLLMDGALRRERRYDGYLRGEPFTFGTISTAGAGRLAGQDVSAVTNRMTFSAAGGAGSEALTLWVTRLSPAVLVECGGPSLSLFGRPAALRPLRWAAPGADGKVLTGVLARQKAAPFTAGLEMTGISRAKSLAPAKASPPPLADLAAGWLLLWYGSDSPFGSTPMPQLDWKVKASRPRAPYWPLDETVFQADVPVLLVFQNPPTGLDVDADRGLTFRFAASAGRVALMPVFGHVVQHAEDTEKWLAGLPKDVAERCATWARWLASFPVDVKRTAAYDAAADRVTHTEHFEFLAVRPGQERFAPLPAMVALARQMGAPIELSRPIAPGAPLATRFGPAAVVAGEEYSWSVVGLGRCVRQRGVVGPSNARSAPLEAELVREVDRVLAAGHLAPLFYTFVSADSNVRAVQSTRYWTDSSETLHLLAELLCVLPPGRQAKLREYMQRERTAWPPEKVLHVSRAEGTRRERFSYARDAAWLAANDRPSHKSDEFRGEDEPSLYRAYGLSRCCLATGAKPGDDVLAFCRAAMARSLAGRQWDTLAWFRGKYAWRYRLLRNAALHQFTLRCVNRDLAGAIGSIRLHELASREAGAEAWGQFARLAVLRFALGKYAHYQARTGLIGPPRDAKAAKRLLRIADFRKPESFFHQVLDVDQHGVTLTHGAVPPEPITFGAYLVPYRDLVSEAARLLADWGMGPETRAFLDHYAARNGSWFALFGDAVDGRETPWLFLGDMHQLFLAHAWLARTKPDRLVRYVDVPYAKVGDLFYLHKLAEAIKACRGVTYPPAGR